MTLYADFASHYDYVFPVDKTAATYLHNSFPPGLVLDLGCATGGYVLALAAKGRQVMGVDLDDRMIRIAKEKAARASLYAAFSVADIRTLDAVGQFAGAYCIGNTLVHLESETEIGAMIQTIHRALAPGGIAVVQIVNYDRILESHVTQLAPITNGGRVFTRAYEIEPDAIRFKTVLTYKEEKYEAETRLVPLRAASLKAMFERAGFVNISLHAGFDRMPFDPARSFALVVKGMKI